MTLEDGAAHLRVAHRQALSTRDRGRNTAGKNGIADQARSSAVKQTGQPRGDISRLGVATVAAVRRDGREGGEGQATVPAGAGLLLEPIDFGIATWLRGNVPTQPSPGGLLARVVGDVEGSTPATHNHDIAPQLPHRRLEGGPEVGALPLGAGMVRVEVDVSAPTAHRRPPEGHHPSSTPGCVDRGEARRGGVVLAIVILDAVGHEDVAGGGAQTSPRLGQGLDRTVNGKPLRVHQAVRIGLLEQLTGDIGDRALFIQRLLQRGLEDPA
ncbi:hypothetical protein D7Y27_36795 [Corallococcus sp. AB004]|nr:hypothetical protein D7Y27_36795 [Corallococcus sp. AB004]